MVLSKKSQVINREFLFSKIDSWDVFRMYLPVCKPKETICSPLRRDKNPSWVLFYGETEWVYKDFATGDSGDCIKLVRQMFGLRYQEALEKIAKDFLLTADNGQQYKQITSQYEHPNPVKHRSFIQVTTRPFNDKDLQYWQRYGIDRETLVKEHIYSVKELYVDRKRRPVDNMCFCYWFPDGFKIYQPTRARDDGKWLSSIPVATVENLQVLDTHDKIVISKSRKDRITLSQLFPDIGIINVQNEGKSAFTDEFVARLEGKQIWLSFDSDQAGKIASKKINEQFPWMKHINVPDQYNPFKDWAEIRENIGPEPIIEHFKLKGVII